jgi:hypothetical protein
LGDAVFGEWRLLATELMDFEGAGTTAAIEAEGDFAPLTFDDVVCLAVEA